MCQFFIIACELTMFYNSLQCGAVPWTRLYSLNICGLGMLGSDFQDSTDFRNPGEKLTKKTAGDITA
jgi:hypothetical protein